MSILRDLNFWFYSENFILRATNVDFSKSFECEIVHKKSNIDLGYSELEKFIIQCKYNTSYYRPTLTNILFDVVVKDLKTATLTSFLATKSYENSQISSSLANVMTNNTYRYFSNPFNSTTFFITLYQYVDFMNFPNFTAQEILSSKNLIGFCYVNTSDNVTISVMLATDSNIMIKKPVYYPNCFIVDRYNTIDLQVFYCGNSTLTTTTNTNSGQIQFRYDNDVFLRNYRLSYSNNTVNVLSSSSTGIVANAYSDTIQVNQFSVNYIYSLTWNSGDTTYLDTSSTYQCKFLNGKLDTLNYVFATYFEAFLSHKNEVYNLKRPICSSNKINILGG